MNKAKATIDHLLGHAMIPNAPLNAEVTDAMWADYGRMVHRRLMSDGLADTLNRAGMKAKSTREMAAMVRAFILTETKP